MKIREFDTYPLLSKAASVRVMEDVYQKPDMLLCIATGSSPLGLYAEMAAAARIEKHLFDKLRIVKLDEWVGLENSDPASCEYYIQKHILSALHIPPSNYISFRSNTEDTEAECTRMQAELDKMGPIDLCILGLGKNGHLGLNEPGDSLKPYCHIEMLSEESRNHTMVTCKTVKPRYGFTLGMKDILSSKKILLLVSGEGKSAVTTKLLENQVTNQLPASLLWLHPNTECLIDNTIFKHRQE